MTFHSQGLTAATPLPLEPAVAWRFVSCSRSTDSCGPVDDLGGNDFELQRHSSIIRYSPSVESSAVGMFRPTTKRATQKGRSSADTRWFLEEIRRDWRPLDFLYAEVPLFSFDQGAYYFTGQDRRDLISRGIRSRVKSLADDARDEGEAFSTLSESALFLFIETIGPSVAPAIFRLESGNLRAVWKGGGGVQFALEFITEDRAQYVAFGRPSRREAIVRSVGIAGFEGAMLVAEAHKVKDLMFL